MGVFCVCMFSIQLSTTLTPKINEEFHDAPPSPEQNRTVWYLQQKTITLNEDMNENFEFQGIIVYYW